ncbi:MAG TPA: FkbM family methyltransferase [Solirubrobacteraceae bacterium]|nr:FkbM family methyltransferase [Solirubrobacteraceae bacterium]
MPNLANALRDRFVLVNLGAGGDHAADLPVHLRAAATVVEVDAADASVDRSDVHRRVAVRQVVADEPGRRTFRENAYVSCSSLLPPRDDLIARYGLTEYFRPVAEEEVECTTLPAILAEAGIDRLDFLKTDIEGLDTAVLRSSRELLERALVVRSELRFEPFYVGEAPFGDALAYLDELGFELIGLDPEVWKPATQRAARHRDGRTVWADCVFVRRPELVAATGGDDPAGLPEAKQVLLTAMTGLRSWAEHLLGVHGGRIPAEWRDELWQATAPAPRTRLRAKALDAIARARRRVPPRPAFDFRHVA